MNQISKIRVQRCIEDKLVEIKALKNKVHSFSLINSLTREIDILEILLVYVNTAKQPESLFMFFNDLLAECNEIKR